MSPHGVFVVEDLLRILTIRALKPCFVPVQCSSTLELVFAEIFFFVIISAAHSTPRLPHQRFTPVSLEFLKAWVGFPLDLRHDGFHQTTFSSAVLLVVGEPDTGVEHLATLETLVLVSGFVLRPGGHYLGVV